ncbi:Hypothetical protein PHPALM_13926 [Phytophthora palmivora]|uniref:Uncharacterized protein n=1 Tax=Phytophthora palmivora TaxID=4796 RepID=A0A2P4XW16_9STRA|nr:Hypothetical protein PHPALM_13926 [Phytophthora palmivora]
MFSCDPGSTSSATDQLVAQVLMGLAHCVITRADHDVDVEQVASSTHQASSGNQVTATDWSVTTADQLPSATELAVATDSTATVRTGDEVYFPTYSKYYSSKRVTVRLAMQLRSRSGEGYVSMIAVILIVVKSTMCCGSTTYLEMTLLSAPLLDDNFADELHLEDRWKASKVTKLKYLWSKDEFGKSGWS